MLGGGRRVDIKTTLYLQPEVSADNKDLPSIKFSVLSPGSDLTLIADSNSLALHSSGSPKQSFPMFFSSRPQSEGKSSSLPCDLRELMVLGPKNTLLTPLVIGLRQEELT